MLAASSGRDLITEPRRRMPRIIRRDLLGLLGAESDRGCGSVISVRVIARRREKGERERLKEGEEVEARDDRRGPRRRPASPPALVFSSGAARAELAVRRLFCGRDRRQVAGTELAGVAGARPGRRSEER